jgi:hypothetical protein
VHRPVIHARLEPRRGGLYGPLIVIWVTFLFADVTSSITHFVSFEIFGWDRMLRCDFLAALWHCAFVPVLGAVAIVYVAFKLVAP